MVYAHTYRDEMNKHIFFNFKAEAEYKTVHGKPGEAVVSAAKHLHATLVVTGTRGLGTLRRTIMGSVSDYIVHHAHCPVLVCREYKH